MDPWAYLDEFRTEAAEHLRALDAQLLRLESAPADPQPVRQMLLSAHTIKGGAAMLGLGAVKRLAHAVEDVLVHLRDTGTPLNSTTADRLFPALDLLRELAAVATPGAPGDDPRVGPLEDGLRACVPSAPTGADAAPAERERPAVAPTSPDGGGGPEPGETATDSRPRALLVDDSPTVRLLETMLLEEAGYVVDALADGGEALARARTLPYQLVVTSIETRGLRGLDLAAAVRMLPAGASVPIIVMSSDDNPAHRQAAADVGVQAYIRKGSLGERRLLETARELLRARDG
jgi:CheY-like chemotaxis protein/HPt (histidine-containing phosphotransfer) domain-containing protein